MDVLLDRSVATRVKLAHDERAAVSRDDALGARHPSTVLELLPRPADANGKRGVVAVLAVATSRFAPRGDRVLARERHGYRPLVDELRERNRSLTHQRLRKVQLLVDQVHLRGLGPALDGDADDSRVCRQRKVATHRVHRPWGERQMDGSAHPRAHSTGGRVLDVEQRRVRVLHVHHLERARGVGHVRQRDFLAVRPAGLEVGEQEAPLRGWGERIAGKLPSAHNLRRVQPVGVGEPLLGLRLEPLGFHPEERAPPLADFDRLLVLRLLQTRRVAVLLLARRRRRRLTRPRSRRRPRRRGARAPVRPGVPARLVLLTQATDADAFAQTQFPLSSRQHRVQRLSARGDVVRDHLSSLGIVPQTAEAERLGRYARHLAREHRVSARGVEYVDARARRALHVLFRSLLPRSTTERPGVHSVQLLLLRRLRRASSLLLLLLGQTRADLLHAHRVVARVAPLGGAHPPRLLPLLEHQVRVLPLGEQIRSLATPVRLALLVEAILRRDVLGNLLERPFRGVFQLQQPPRVVDVPLAVHRRRGFEMLANELKLLVDAFIRLPATRATGLDHEPLPLRHHLPPRPFPGVRRVTRRLVPTQRLRVRPRDVRDASRVSNERGRLPLRHGCA